MGVVGTSLSLTCTFPDISWVAQRARLAERVSPARTESAFLEIAGATAPLRIELRMARACDCDAATRILESDAEFAVHTR